MDPTIIDQNIKLNDSESKLIRMDYVSSKSSLVD